MSSVALFDPDPSSTVPSTLSNHLLVGPESRYRYHLPTDEGDLQESSNMRNLDRVGAKGEQDHPVTDLEHSESEAEGDVDGEEASSSDSDLESQLKEWHDGVQSTASGSGVEAEGQTGLQ